jgi:hypothetical protein
MAVYLLLVGGVAWAQQEAVYLDYEAPRGCPGRSAFVGQVRARTSRVCFVDEPAGVRTFVVRLTTGEKNAKGRLASGLGDQAGTPREVTAESCADAVSALALIAALAVDPAASTSPSAPAPVAPESPPAAPPGTWPSGASPAPAALPGPRVTPAPVNSLFAGAHIDGSSWIGAPAVMFGSLSAFVQWETRLGAVWTPALRLSIRHGESLTVQASQGGARFASTTGRLDVCPASLALSVAVALRPCIAIEGGGLTAERLGEAGTVPGHLESRTWFAAHEVLRIQAELGKGWRFELEGGVAEPFWHYRFVFATPGRPNVEIARVSALVPAVGTGICAHFL